MAKKKNRKAPAPANAAGTLLLKISGALAVGVIAAAGYAHLQSEPSAPVSTALTSTISTIEAEDTGSRPSFMVPRVQGKSFGITMGPRTGAPEFYVFFDPQCPHCAVLWKELEPFADVARFNWVPVGILSQKSKDQGAALLSSDDPLAAMKAHEISMGMRSGGLPVSGAQDPLAAEKVLANTKLFSALHVNSVPLLFGVNPRTGREVQHMGSAGGIDIAEFLGLTVGPHAAE